MKSFFKAIRWRRSQKRLASIRLPFIGNYRAIAVSGYRPDIASQRYFVHRRKPNKLRINGELKSLVMDKLKDGRSPHCIAVRLKVTAKQCVVSPEALYRFIYSQQGMRLKL